VEKLKLKIRQGSASGTIYLTPGLKTIRMTVTDRHGRQSWVERQLMVTWQLFYPTTCWFLIVSSSWRLNQYFYETTQYPGNL
jgi:hypothetical protein